MADDAHRPEVPPSVDDSAERIGGRPYESDFARFPDAETLPHTGVGGGPKGPVAEGLNVPLVVMALGAVLTFGVFFVTTWVLLVLGLLVILVGAAMSIVTHHRPGRRGGLGRSPVPPS